ncbi:hypothetical protein ABFS83_12G039700 [Erythranthe nasuta]
MVMDAKDIQLDLHALKSLYGLLEKDRNRTSNADSLDEHARLLLKNLLDAETKKVLKLHSEIISGEVELSKKEVTPSSKSLVSAQPNRSFDKDTNTDGLLDITLWGPTSYSGAQTRKKRCRVCLRNTVKEPTEDDETIFFDVAQNLNSDEETYESRELDCLSKEASEAIKKIELCISAFDIWADHLHLFEEDNNISAQTRFRNFDTRQNNFVPEFSNQRFVNPLHRLPIMTSAEKTNQPFLLLGQPFKIVQPTTKPVFRQSTNNYIVDNVESSYHGSTMVAHGKNQSKKAPQNDEIPTNKRATKTYIQDQESESTSTDSYSNSPYSDSEEYSSPDKTREQLQYASTTSSTSSEIANSLTSHSGDTSNTEEEEEDEFYSSGSSDATPRGVTSSSKSEGYLSYLSVGPTSKKSSRKKQIGMWRSLKDRLAVIFHHHHHHHHHHDDYGGKDGRKKMSRNKSLRRGRADSFKREHEAYGEKASKSVVREKKKNHFNGLVEGLLKHVRNSKKEPTKKKKKRGNESDCRQLIKGGKKNSKKPSPHWLKLMKLHQGGKLTNKGLVTIGLGKKKARLKALPTIK